MKASKTNSMNGAEAMVRLLEANGVEYIFGLCGDTSLPFYDALYTLNHKIKHILTRDERHASYMAEAYARVTGKIGVCEGPSGGGATYIIPGVIEANESSVGLIAITSDVARSSVGKYSLTELRQDELFKPLTKWNAILENANLPSLIRKAFRVSSTGRPGATHLCFPIDVQKSEIDPSDIWSQKDFSTFPAWPTRSGREKIKDFVKIIEQSSKPLIICGGAILFSKAEKIFKEIVEKYNIAVASTISGKGSLEDDHQNYLGVVGSNGAVLETREVVQNADLVIFIGCRAGSVTTEKWQYPNHNQKIIHIDNDPEVISANYKTELSIVSDAKLFLEDLQEIGLQKVFNGKEDIKKPKESKWKNFYNLAKSSSLPIKPERIVSDLNSVLPDDCYIVADAGTPCPYFSAFFKLKKSGKYFLSNRAHGALGYALPAAIGVQIGMPNNRVVSVMGDGSFGLAVGELETAVRLKLPIIFIVLSNSVYGWIKAGQKTSFEERYYSVDFTRTNHAEVAKAYGLDSFRVEKPEHIKKTIEKALSLNKPCLVDIISEPLQDTKAPVSEWIA
ncbi:MAG: thiamine pyrophosphate-binding protein [Proteobacteria bacterium]|nr:thiamine pyrophosphate-binding protein [Pseudomonadota bacterium]